MSKTAKIRLVVVDDHAILRSGLRMLINAQPDMEVVGEAEDGLEATRVIQAANPNVAILDVTMPRSGGLDAIKEIVTRNRSTRILLLTMHEEPAYLRTALAAGATGYVLKKSVDADLLSAIRAVHRGRTYVDSELAEILVRDAINKDGKTDSAAGSLLSDRELQVLKLVAEGFSSREISEQIYISTKTVETYRARFAEKLGLKSRAQIVRYALNLGLLSPEKFTEGRKRARVRS
ncbi:MAG TPA: response regulator transcription factor [Candidatus Binatia bacterium]|nr:response regulator transcription factor [Candidatus Binatia bacterium]